MQYFDRGAALDIVSDIELSASGRRVLNHWFSLWDGDALPSREAIRPADLKSQLANLILFDVVPDKSVLVRLAGTSFGLLLGIELTGKDWIALAPTAHKFDRLRFFSDIAVGAIGRCIRTLETHSGDLRPCEEILLPFRQDADTDARLVLGYVDWDSGRDDTRLQSLERGWGAPLAFETIQLPVMRAPLNRG